MAELKGLDDESREMVLETVRLLRKRLLNRDNILQWDAEETFPEETIRSLLGEDLGLQLLFIPEEYGGLGGGARDCCAVTKEMSKICLGVATAFFAIQLGADPLLVGATEEQKEKWLGTIAQGNTLVAYAVTEPGAGSNLAALKTKAEPIANESGEITGYTINGNKQFISTGGYADFITLLAKTPEGPSFFIVEKGTPGFTQGKGEEKHGIRASNTSPLSFTDAVVPKDHLIGGIPGAGMKQANQVFGYTRLMVAAMALGAGEAVQDIVIPYAKERIQFGSPLSEKQGYTHKLVVPHAVNLEAATAYVDEIAVRLDSGEKDLQVEGSIAKYFATETSNKAADDAMQALGGYGYIREFGVEKIKRDVKITCIYEGTSEIQQTIISTFRWKTTRKTKGAYYGDLSRQMAEIDSLHPDLGARLISMAATALNEVINLAHEYRLTRRQYIMFILADIMAQVEVAASLVNKAKTSIEADNSNSEKLRLMSRFFACETSRMIADNIAKIVYGTDVLNETEAQEFMERISYNQLIRGCSSLIADMDRIADILFER